MDTCRVIHVSTRSVFCVIHGLKCTKMCIFRSFLPCFCRIEHKLFSTFEILLCVSRQLHNKPIFFRARSTWWSHCDEYPHYSAGFVSHRQNFSKSKNAHRFFGPENTGGYNREFSAISMPNEGCITGRCRSQVESVSHTCAKDGFCKELRSNSYREGCRNHPPFRKIV